MAGTEREHEDAFYETFAEHVVVDHDGWAHDLTQRVADRIQADIPPGERLIPVVAWIEEQTAFTVPGRHVYFSRNLLQRGFSEDAVAFAFAHELAHHRLGHVRAWLADLPGAWVLGVAAHLARHIVVSPEHEAAADRWALERCVAVGYDRERCLDAFRVLERLSLDVHDVDGVFGPGDPDDLADAHHRSLDGETPGRMDGVLGEAKRWLWQRRRGYPSIRARRAALEGVALGSSPGPREGAPLVDAWKSFVSGRS